MQKYNKNSIKYRKEKRENLCIDLPKGTRDIWRAYAESKGMPLATFIKSFMKEAMDADGFSYEMPDENSDEK